MWVSGSTERRGLYPNGHRAFCVHGRSATPSPLHGVRQEAAVHRSVPVQRRRHEPGADGGNPSAGVSGEGRGDRSPAQPRYVEPPADERAAAPGAPRAYAPSAQHHGRADFSEPRRAAQPRAFLGEPRTIRAATSADDSPAIAARASNPSRACACRRGCACSARANLPDQPTRRACLIQPLRRARGFTTPQTPSSATATHAICSCCHRAPLHASPTTSLSSLTPSSSSPNGVASSLPFSLQSSPSPVDATRRFTLCPSAVYSQEKLWGSFH